MFGFDLFHFILLSVIVLIVLFVFFYFKEYKTKNKFNKNNENSLKFLKKTVKIKSKYGEVLEKTSNVIESKNKLPKPKLLILASAKILALNALIQANRELFNVYRYMYYSVSFFQDIKKVEVKEIKDNDININKLHKKLYRGNKELTKEELNLFIESQTITQKYIKKSQKEGKKLIIEFDNFIKKIKSDHPKVFNEKKYKQWPVLYLFLKNNYPKLVKKIEKAYVKV